MITLLLFLIFNFYAASNYHSSVLVPAYKTVGNSWTVLPDVLPYVNGSYTVNLFTDQNNIVEKKRLTYYCMGLPVAPVPCQNNEQVYPVLSDIFHIIQKNSAPGTYPSDYVVNDVSAAGHKVLDALNLISFGQGADAFRMALVLNGLYKAGLEFDIDGICFGTQQILNCLFLLGHPEEYPQAEKFFAAVGIDRIDREKILSMIRTISLNASLKDPADPVINLLKGKLIQVPGSLLQASIIGGSIFTRSSRSVLTATCVCAGLQFLKSTNGLRPVAKTIFNRYAHSYLPSYDSKYPSIKIMLERMQHYKKDYPQLAGLYMTKKGDPVVGGFDNDIFFQALPMQDERKYLIPSSDSDHVSIDRLQISAKNAFWQKYESSHCSIPSMLKVGHNLLGLAQENQYKNIGHYITEMENRNNYERLSQEGGFDDGLINQSVNELSFNLKKACL